MTLTELADRIGMALANLSSPQDRKAARRSASPRSMRAARRSRASLATFSGLNRSKQKRERPAAASKTERKPMKALLNAHAGGRLVASIKENIK